MKKISMGVAIAAAALIVYAGAAVAQAAEPDTIVRFDGLFGELRPYIMEVLSVLIGAAVLWATKRFSDLTGMKIESKHREALQSALTNGAKLAVDRAGTAAGNVELDVRSVPIAAGINYVLESVPDAVKYFGLSAEKLRELLEPKLVEAKTVAAAAPTTANVVVTVDGDGKIGASAAPAARKL